MGDGGGGLAWRRRATKISLAGGWGKVPAPGGRGKVPAPRGRGEISGRRGHSSASWRPRGSTHPCVAKHVSFFLVFVDIKNLG